MRRRMRRGTPMIRNSRRGWNEAYHRPPRACWGAFNGDLCTRADVRPFSKTERYHMHVPVNNYFVPLKCPLTVSGVATARQLTFTAKTILNNFLVLEDLLESLNPGRHSQKPIRIHCNWSSK
eukprot:scaffold47322_cov68-Cyclotella_meneghiniana.AAC.3